jgi:hypothetical protein
MGNASVLGQERRVGPHPPTVWFAARRGRLRDSGHNMRTLICVVSVLLALYVGEWTYRTFLRPIDQPTEALRALATHFSTSGLPGNFYPVRHGFWHSSVTAVIAYKINDFPVPFTVVDCPSEAAAESRLQSTPSAWLAQRGGSLIIEFPMWGDDTRAMVDGVSRVFLDYNPRS